MSDQAAISERQDRLLSEMAELGMSFARKLEARVEMVQSVDEAGALARAFDRVTRSARLAIALQTRLAKDRHEIARLQRSAADRAVDRRKAQITAVLNQQIFTEERDQDEADDLSERLTDRLDYEALFDEFLDGPIETAVARFREDIGLPDVLLTSPIAAAMAGRGEERGLAEGKADAIDNDLSIAVTNARAMARAGPAEHGEEPGVEGASQAHCRTLARSTTPSAGRGPPPAAKAGEVRKKPGPS